MISYNDSVINKFDDPENGNAAAGATVTVRDATTGAKAAIYSDDGVTPLANPLTTDDYGNYTFFATSGIYDLVINEGLASERIVADVSIFETDTLSYDNVAAMTATTVAIGTKAKCARYYSGGELVSELEYYCLTPAQYGGVPDGYIDHYDAAGNVLALIGKDTASQKQCGAKLDGVADDSDAIDAWLNATTKPAVLSGDCLITRGIVVTSPVYVNNRDFVVKPELGTGLVYLFRFATDDVEFSVTIDGSNGDTATPSVGNKYAVYCGDTNGATKYRNHKISCYITDWDYSDGNTGSSNILVSHGVYVNNVDSVDLKYLECHNISGAAYFIRDCKGLDTRFAKASNTGWYTFNLEEGVEDFCLDFLYSDQTANAAGVYWGGAVNIQSQQDNGGARNSNGSVRFGVFKGKHSYGSVIRVNSCDNVVVENNILDNVTIGTAAAAPDLTGIRVDTRGISTAAQNGPCQNITVKDNRLIAGANAGGKFIGVYASNQWQTARNPMKGLVIENNEIYSADTSNYWSAAIYVHGFSGGVENVSIKNNYGTVYLQSAPIVDGCIGITAVDGNGTVDYVEIGGNNFTDLGTPASSYQVGIAYGGYSNNVFVTSTNRMDNFFYGTRSFTNSSNLYDINDIYCPIFGSLVGLYGVAPKRWKDLGEVLSSTELADASHVVNINKWAGKRVFDTTLGVPLYTASSSATGAWKKVSDDTTAYTPA